MTGYLLSLFIVLEVVAGVMLGTARLSVGQVIHAVLQGPAGHDVITRIVWFVRLPRCLLALSAGACFAHGGALLQGVTRNALADPYLFGLSSGAAAGAVAAIVFFGDFAGVWTPFLGASLGGVLATVFLTLFVLSSQKTRKNHLILGGLAISFLFSSLTNVFIFFGDRNAAQSILFWTMGSFSAARWSFIPLVLAGLFLLLGFRWLYQKPLLALLAGEDTARSIGVETHALRRKAILCCALGCGVAVCVCGPIPFIGLVVPHIARFMSQRMDGVGYITALGALLTLGADIASRCLLPVQEMPVGVLISAMGSVFLMVMLLKKEAL